MGRDKEKRDEKRDKKRPSDGLGPCPLVGAYDRTIPVDADGVADLHGDAEAQYYEEGL